MVCAACSGAAGAGRELATTAATTSPGSPTTTTAARETVTTTVTAPETTTATATAPETATATVTPTTTDPTDVDTGDLGEVEVAIVHVGDRRLLVSVADDRDERVQGLRGVEDLGDLDGMLFAWDGSQVHVAFTMQDTLVPLDIAFFAADGGLVDLLTMTPCQAEPCPSYLAGGAFSHALEAPAGSLAGLDPSARLRLPDPAAGSG